MQPQRHTTNQGTTHEIQYQYKTNDSISRVRIPRRLILTLLYALIVGGGQAQLCSKYYTASVNGTSSCNMCFSSMNDLRMCQITNTTGITEESCRNICCPLTYTNPVPSTCLPQESEGNSQTFAVGTVLVIIFFTIPVVICIIALIHSCVTRAQRRPPPNIPRISREEPPVSAVNLADYNLDDHYPYLIDINDSCSICLEANCNVVTLCSHPYHAKCFSAWIHKKNKCPLCVSRNFNPVAAYCTQCFKAKKLTLIHRKMSAQDTNAWVQNCQFKCQACMAPAQDAFSISMDEENIEKYQNWKRPENPVVSKLQIESSAAEGGQSNTQIKRQE